MKPADPSFFFPAPVLQKFCTQCGGQLTRLVLEGDHAPRDVCLHCGAVHYRNPLVVVGAIPVYRNKILLCQRAIEPRYGTWTFPSGFMELNESSAEGAARETLEEAGATVQIGNLHCVINIPDISQIHIYYLAHCSSDYLDPGPESLAAGFYDLAEIPWENLAFRSIRTALEHYVNDLNLEKPQPHIYELRKKDF
ncbi:NUDIX hydrolase [Brackiella oedipodis]|uniref:NUDIX hydrolase n=1 Tax=Brackiella oedipodis TaxID=124225 RepID=UPI00048D8708|nr:NUDIX hydrolase [Brackiella oedipodis]